MNGFNELLLKWKFKKILIVFLVFALVSVLGSAVAGGIVFRDSISFAAQYNKVKDAAQTADASELKQQADRLASLSHTVDVLILDEQGQVTYSARNSSFAEQKPAFQKTGSETGFFTLPGNDSTLFRYVKSDTLLLYTAIGSGAPERWKEYTEQSQFEQGYSGKTVYLLNMIGADKQQSRVCVIGNPTAAAGGRLTLKLISALLTLLFTAYWVLTALWIYQNAARAKLYPLLWGFAVLLTNLVGVLVYFLYKRGSTTCPECGASQDRSHLFCVFCGRKMKETCKVCAEPLSERDVFCPGCGNRVK